jgi:DNA-binding MarR family transcriptional regulator
VESHEDLAKNLEQIGLTNKEAKVYLALLALESSTAYEIAQHCEVKKPTVYVILEDLRQKGLVLKVPHAKKAIFAAKDLSEYLAEQRGKLNAVQSMLPRLQALGGAQKPKVYFFQGFRGTHEALNYKFDAMRGTTVYGLFGNLTAADPKQIAMLEEADREMTDSGINFKIVMPEAEKENQQKLIELGKETGKIEFRFLKEYSYPSNISIVIGPDFVRIIDSQKIYATVIDDATTAAAMRQIFDIVWAKGE